MEYYEKEILEKTFEITRENCSGCLNDWPSQKDHECLDSFHFNLNIWKAIEIIKQKYEIDFDSIEVFEKLEIL